MRESGRCDAPALELVFGSSGDPLHAAELELRRRVLAEPLGLPLSAVRFEFEQTSLHLWALQAGTLIGCVLFQREDGRGGRLYQMAVDAGQQRRGIGRRLVQRLEAQLRKLAVHEVRLHARAPVVGFYERLGYSCYDEPFVEVGIEHRRMRRAL